MEYSSHLLLQRTKFFWNQMWLEATSWPRQLPRRLKKKGKWNCQVKRRKKFKKKNKNRRHKKKKRAQVKKRIVRVMKVLKGLWLQALRIIWSVEMTLACNCKIVYKQWKQGVAARTQTRVDAMNTRLKAFFAYQVTVNEQLTCSR